MGQELADRLRAFLESDPAAAAWLYDTFAPRIYRRLRQRYGYLEDADVEDLLHDAFVLSFKNGLRIFERFLDGTPCREATEEAIERRLWDLACGLATNRRRSATVQRVVPIGEKERRSSEPDAERSAMDRELLARLNSCLAARSERIYLYFKLRYRDGLTPQEVSRTTGWSKKATYKLKQRLDEAIQRCAQLLEIQ